MRVAIPYGKVLTSPGEIIRTPYVRALPAESAVVAQSFPGDAIHHLRLLSTVAAALALARSDDGPQVPAPNLRPEPVPERELVEPVVEHVLHRVWLIHQQPSLIVCGIIKHSAQFFHENADEVVAYVEAGKIEDGGLCQVIDGREVDDCWDGDLHQNFPEKFWR